MRNKKALIIIIVVVVAVAGATLVAGIIGTGSTSTTVSSQTSDENAASSTVAAFGQTLQQVSLMAPDAATMIANTYAPYVDPALLQQWEADPQSAPGKVVSSPWPDHIQINSIAPQGSGYVVDGELVFMSSAGVDNTTPVVIQLANENGSWKIVAFQGQATQ
jgi:hypothetical protein